MPPKDVHDLIEECRGNLLSVLAHVEKKPEEETGHGLVVRRGLTALLNETLDKLKLAAEKTAPAETR